MAHSIVHALDPSYYKQGKKYPFDPARAAAMGEIVTGLLYVEPDADDLHDAMNTVDTPLNKLPDADLIPSVADLEKINASLR